jgi:hypothetical protein
VTCFGSVSQSNGGGFFSVCNNILSVQFMGAGLKEPAEELAGLFSVKSDVLVKLLFPEPVKGLKIRTQSFSSFLKHWYRRFVQLFSYLPFKFNLQRKGRLLHMFLCL